MGSVKWTNEQQDAILEKSSNILVAAAAGSGKTAVLVERIINKIINENIDIDRLLVVTFTNAAASEMRQRVLDAIYKKLESEPNNLKLQRQINLVNKASICTIDSFCLEIVRNNFYELENVSPNFRIADTTEIDLLKQEVIEELFEKKYEEENEDFVKLIQTYTSYKDDTPLKELILKIYTYIQSNPFPEKWLKDKVEMFNLQDKLEEDFGKTQWGEILLQEAEEELIDDITALQKVEEDLSYEPELDKFQQVVCNDIEQLEVLKNNINNWDRAYEIYQNTKFLTWPRQKIDSLIKDEAKKVRDDIKKKFNRVLDSILIANSVEANNDIYDMYETLCKLRDCVFEFGQQFSKIKREKNIVDFNDIEHFALKILLNEENGNLIPSEVAKRYKEKYVEIAIDEYQDSNLVQEYILNSISDGKNVFMVGDVKQSIYKFRQAMPELFLSKYESYKNKEKRTENDNLKIKLFKNFRSRDKVLQFTNMIFEDIMSNILGDIEYNQEEYLNLGADYPDIDQSLNTEINIIDLAEVEDDEKEIEINETENEEEEENLENIELEARFVANRIHKLIEEKYQVWDRKQNQYRDIEYKDIVVLLRSTSSCAPVYEQEILNLDIPVFSDSSQEYLDSIEIQTIMSLLKIIDNPIQDIPLVTVMRSSIGKFTDDELVQIRLSDSYDNFYTCLKTSLINVSSELKEKIECFLNKLEQWREEKEYLGLDELIWKLYSDTGYYHYAGLMKNGELRQANLKMLFQRAKQYETSNFKGLYHFIRFIDQLKLSSGDLGSAKLIGENDNVVRIMSIHKSKGLEFPVVFLSNTSKQFNLMDLNQNILLHQELGIGVKYINYDKQVQYDTLSKSAIRNKIFTENLSEEMRILYVALTRAKEKLIITGIVKDYAKEIEKMMQQIDRYSKVETKINPILVKKYKKYLDWIMMVYFYDKQNLDDMVEWNVHKHQEVLKSFIKITQQEDNFMEMFEEKEIDKKELEKIQEILTYEYPNKLAVTIPTKTSVTKIKQMENENIPNLEELIDKKQKQENENQQKNQEFKTPNFLKEQVESKLTGAQKGTLVHLCLQKLDEKVEYDLEKVKQLINELENKNIVTSKEAQNINPYKILEFTKSDIWKELKEAKAVYKEKPFYLNVPASEIYNEDLEENILVQGIIDLYYIDKNDNLILVDYKTDYVEEGKEKELVSKYQKQLELYERALTQALNKNVGNKYIYSVYLGKTLRI